MYSPVWISLKTAFTATIITFFLGVFAAWRMARYQGKAKGLLDGILTAPIVLPPTVIGFLLLLALGKNSFIGKVLDLVGIRIIFTWYATVIAAVVVSFPLMYKTALAAFTETYDGNLIACARTLGASEATIFWRIIFPLAKSGLIAGTLLAFARALGEFGATLMVAGSIPGKTQTIPVAIFFAAESGAMDRALQLVIILLIISIGVMVGASYWQDLKIQSHGTMARGRVENKHKRQQQSQTSRQIRLEVDIQKQLPEFLLNVAFTIDSHNHQPVSLGILGASGAGKSTLLRCIAGLETPDRGRIAIGDRILFDSAKGINLTPQERRVGLLFQDYALFPHLSIAENIAFGMSAENSASEVKQKVNQNLSQVNLSQMGNLMTHQLSGGEKQRVALARLLASQPDITLLDEPLSALDTNLKKELTKLLQQQINNYSALSLYVTHNLSQAYQLCSQLLIIDRGKAIAFNDKKNIINHPPNLQTAKILGYSNFSAVRKIAPQTVRALDWQWNLKCDSNIPDSIEYIAVHSQAINFVDNDNDKAVNMIPVELADYLELPDGVILYLKINSSSQRSNQPILEANISCDRWNRLKSKAYPWYVQILPSKIIFW